MLATPSDVQDRLGRELTEEEIGRVDGLIAEASALVSSYLGGVAEPAPEQVTLVVSRMAARVLQVPKQPASSAEQVSYTSGPFAQSIRFSSGASGGGPWLTASDKLMLKPFRKRRRGGVYSVDLT